MRILLILSVLLSVACSHQRMYESSEDMREQYCENLDDHAREACLEQARMSYDDYERNRQSSIEQRD